MFGMGTRGTPPPSSPNRLLSCVLSLKTCAFKTANEYVFLLFAKNRLFFVTCSIERR